jgi:flagellar biosynthesis protein FlhG
MMIKDAHKKNNYVKTIAIASGKGGVGKTNVSANLAVALSRLGKKVMIVDGDLGMSNIDVLFSVEPKHTILHLLRADMSLQDIVVEGPHGIKILAAGNGVQELTALDSSQRLKILDAFDSYETEIDVLLIDTAAGISENVAFFCIAAQDIIIVTSPEPTSIADAHALIKVLYTQYGEKKFHVLVNSARNAAEALDVFRKLHHVSDAVGNISLEYLGFLPFDESVQNAVRAQKPFIDMYPERSISKNISDIAGKFLQPVETVKGTLQFFIGSLLSSSNGFR